MPGLVLLAFCAAQLLSQIPVTPGGLGFVEAGLTATLVLAGVDAADAVLATFIYRLFTYWLPLPVGLAAFGLHQRHASGKHGPAGMSRRPAAQMTGEIAANAADEIRWSGPEAA